MSKPPAIVACPICGKPVSWTAASPWRPFCSERCRLIDLGEWLNEERRIPSEETANVDTDISEDY
jgi:endogenous inhibitor of DNA gyrase (YacG/DUF329 family)